MVVAGCNGYCHCCCCCQRQLDCRGWHCAVPTAASRVGQAACGLRLPKGADGEDTAEVVKRVQVLACVFYQPSPLPSVTFQLCALQSPMFTAELAAYLLPCGVGLTRQHIQTDPSCGATPTLWMTIEYAKQFRISICRSHVPRQCGQSWVNHYSPDTPCHVEIPPTVMEVDFPEEEKGFRSNSSTLPSAGSQLPKFSLTKSVITAVERSRAAAAPATTVTDPAPFWQTVPGAQPGETYSDNDNDEEENGYEYVTHIERNCDGSKLAAALSCREVKLYARDTLCYQQDAMRQGHDGPITQLAFAPGDPFALFSASEDGTVKGWDTRTSGKSAMCFGQSGEEIWSMAVSGRK